MHALLACVLQVSYLPSWRSRFKQNMSNNVLLLLSFLGYASYLPCYSRACISRFRDCPLCGADIEKIEADEDLQKVVDKFIDGHARIKRSHANTDDNEAVNENKPVIYEDVSLERGAFLIQQAMRVSAGGRC